MEAVIFDMDGVLIDSENLWKQAKLEIFSSLGVILNDEDCVISSSMNTSEVKNFWLNKYLNHKTNELSSQHKFVKRMKIMSITKIPFSILKKLI